MLHKEVKILDSELFSSLFWGVFWTLNLYLANARYLNTFIAHNKSLFTVFGWATLTRKHNSY